MDITRRSSAILHLKSVNQGLAYRFRSTLVRRCRPSMSYTRKSSRRTQFATHIPRMSDHKDLKVFRLSNSNALSLYRATRGIKGSDNLAIRSQLTRAAFSIPANLVEGNKALS